ncbi:MAG TPA: peptidase domain-containing ABC transporter [Bacteroidales bacterium]|nr:peptidase domain-containing ABC transporter [Bacteroidales bacterium]
MTTNLKRIKEVSLLQHDSTDCGAACLASVIRYFGGESGIEKIRKLSGTSQAGTSMLGLYQAALECGMEATGYEATINDIIAFEGILILHVTPERGYEHYMVAYGYADDRFTVWDPASGLTFKSASEIERIWVSHKCLAVSPGKGFRYQSAEKKEKRIWLIETIKPDKELLLISVFIGILISVLGIVMAVFTQKLIDRILPSGEVRILVVSSVLVLLLLGFRVILSAIRQYMLLFQGKSYNIRIVDSFYGLLLDLPKPFFDTRKTGDMVARLNDTMRIQRVISDIASTYIIDILILIITFGMVFWYSVMAGLISLLVLPLFFLLVYRWNKRIITSQHDVMAGYALNEANFINTLRGITEIKSMNWQKIYSARNKSIFTIFQERVFSLGKIKIKLGMITGLAGTFYLIGLLVYTSLQVIGAKMTQGELMAILSLSSTLLPSVMNLALVSIPLSEARVAIERMFEFTRLKPEAEEAVLTDDSLEVRMVTLNNISFRFPGQKMFLSDISLNIEKGKMVALVGESGSGKSTLVNILMRFYLPESGRITVNNSLDSSLVSHERWREAVGLIPQDVHLFNGTLLENIIPEPDEEKVSRLIRMTKDYGLEPFVNSLPLGFATMTGEDGVKLSGGQKQIVAFLRALVHEPEILLIDEGTSGMDRDTELLIINLLTGIKESVGILLVTHRINLIKRLCDTIYILDDRTITASGNHEDLISGNNIYSRFWSEFK